MLDAAAAAATTTPIDWTAIFTGVLAFLTLCYVFITSRQLSTMNNALKHGEESTKESYEQTKRSNLIAAESLELGRRGLGRREQYQETRYASFAGCRQDYALERRRRTGR
jgi:hypothetical protein